MSVRRMAASLSIVMVISAALATSCTDRATKEDEREKEKRQLREENQKIARIRDKLISEGQGCDGEILQGEALQDLLIGKHHQYVVPGAVSVGSPTRGLKHFSYKSNGTLHYSSASPGVIAEYTVDQNQFCHEFAPLECFRLIKDNDGVIFSEYIHYIDKEKSSANKVRLQCVALEIRDLENGE